MTQGSGDPQELKAGSNGGMIGTAEAVALPVLSASAGVSPAHVSPAQSSSQLLKLALRYGAIGLVIAIMAGWLWARLRAVGADRVPVRIGMTLNSVQAFDGNNGLLWSHPYSLPFEDYVLKENGPFAGFSGIGDYLGDGELEVLVPVLLHEVSGEVDLFSGSGKLLWKYVPDRSFQFGKHELHGNWALTSLFAAQREKEKTIWAGFAHGVWGNAFVVKLDPQTGKDTLRFVNTGTIRSLNEIHAGKTFLLVGGFNNEPDWGSLAVIDEATPFAISPQTKGTRHECVSCPPGNVDYYFEFPRSELTDLRQLHEDAVRGIHVTGNQIEVVKNALTDGSTAVHYILRADEEFKPVALRFGSSYDMLHRQYEREGKLNHTLENCPERLHPRPIRMWTPAGGWTEIQLPPAPFNQ